MHFEDQFVMGWTVPVMMVFVRQLSHLILHSRLAALKFLDPLQAADPS
jgi:hypothetical protein